MPGTSTTGVHRLKMWTFALLVGVAAALASLMPAWATCAPGGTALAPSAASGTGAVVDAVAVRAAGTATDLSVEGVSAPPAAVPWILVALLVLVVAGAVRAYSRSPQRAAIRSRRNSR